MKIEAVIFDHDGVLNAIDYQAAAAFFGPLIPLSMRELGREWEQWAGMQPLDQDEGLWFRFCAYLSDTFDLPVASRRALHAFNLLTLFQAFSDARPALLDVRRHGLKVGVLSNTALTSLDEPLAWIGLSDLIDVTIVRQVAGAPKPAAAAYLTIARQLGVDPKHCLFFDDELVNVDGARAVGMTGYLVDRAREQHNLLEGVVCDLSAIPDILQAVET